MWFEVVSPTYVPMDAAGCQFTTPVTLRQSLLVLGSLSLFYRTFIVTILLYPKDSESVGRILKIYKNQIQLLWANSDPLEPIVVLTATTDRDLGCGSYLLTCAAQSFSLENPINWNPFQAVDWDWSSIIIPGYERIVASSIGLTSETYLIGEKGPILLIVSNVF
jgi:hypothetical protein